MAPFDPDAPPATRKGREQPFTPPPAQPLWPWVAAALLLGVGLAVWWGGRLGTEPAVLLPEATQDAPTSPPAEPALPTEPAATLQAPAVGEGAESSGLRRCTTPDGRVSYTEAPCPSGAQTAWVEVPQSSGLGNAAGVHVTLQLCRTNDDRYFWSATPCHERNARIDRLAQVPAHLSFQRQVQEAERQRRAARVLQEQASRPPAGNRQGNRAGQPSKESRCKDLDALVQWLDAEARQPLSAQRQDRIRVKRKAARDEQFALRC